MTDLNEAGIEAALYAFNDVQADEAHKSVTDSLAAAITAYLECERGATMVELFGDRLVAPTPETREPSEAVREALRKLIFAAETSGGTAGRDEGLCAAIEAALQALAAVPKAPSAEGWRTNAIGVGMVIAAGIVESALGETTAAKEILGAAGITTIKEARKIGVDEYDIRLLKNVFMEFDATPPMKGEKP